MNICAEICSSGHASYPLVEFIRLLGAATFLRAKIVEDMRGNMWLQVQLLPFGGISSVLPGV